MLVPHWIGASCGKRSYAVGLGPSQMTDRLVDSQSPSRMTDSLAELPKEPSQVTDRMVELPIAGTLAGFGECQSPGQFAERIINERSHRRVGIRLGELLTTLGGLLLLGSNEHAPSWLGDR
ncbi:hypothetical protein NG796_26050 [Laspinema sp. A4]|uniref:hypothetical protein n=1 Tax=Laspinema sp. D2d TaxID=2953686 RepID=UPI0021BB228F|nr:hypothetical protein [Laspinema sp. D2d]MCT7986739.1 hypothetical protein [Laspinema sp. D2d]